MTDISYIEDPTAWGDALAEQMREYFEAHKKDKWIPGTADSLMIGLSNIVQRASSERDQAKKKTSEEVRDAQINAMWRAHRRWLNPAFVSDEDIPHSRNDLKTFYGHLLDAIPNLSSGDTNQDDKPRVGYDPMGDVLYVSFPGAPRSAVCVERNASVLWRFDDKDAVVGVTILDAQHQAKNSRDPAEQKALRERIALALINEEIRFFNTGRKSVTCLSELEEHQYRDQLRYADAIIYRLEEEALFQPTPIKREGYTDEVFEAMCAYVKYAVTTIEDKEGDPESVIEGAVDRILRKAATHSRFSDRETRLRNLISERLLYFYRTGRKPAIREAIGGQADLTGDLLLWLEQLSEETRDTTTYDKDGNNRHEFVRQLRTLATKEEGVGHSYSKGGSGRGMSSINLYGNRADSAIWLFQRANDIADLLDEDGKKSQFKAA